MIIFNILHTYEYKNSKDDPIKYLRVHIIAKKWINKKNNNKKLNKKKNTKIITYLMG